MADPQLAPDVPAVDAAVLRTVGTPAFGVTDQGFVPKPFARILAEKLALARALLGNDLDLSSGSVIRKLLEISALEDARTWAAMAASYDDMFVSTATGEALSRLGEELGLARPFLEARGSVELTLKPPLPAGTTLVNIPRGARMLTKGGHHIATDETVTLSEASPKREVKCVAFYPGAEHNIDPAHAAPDGSFPQKIVSFNLLDPALTELRAMEDAADKELVHIEHTKAFAGGELRWPDTRYRDLLLNAPRSLWTVDALRITASLVPGVRQVQIRDAWGGLDINQSIFGNMNFGERLFSAERDLASPYYFTVLVALTPGAIWSGPDGVEAAVESALENIRPVGIFPRVTPAVNVGIGVRADLVVQGLPLPSGSRETVNQSAAAAQLRERLLLRLRRYFDVLRFGEPVRYSEVIWAIMNEPGIADARNVRLVRFPPRFDEIDFTTAASAAGTLVLETKDNIDLQLNEIAVFVDDDSGLRIV